MNQKGFINILLIVIVVVLVGAGIYVVSTRQVTPPTPTITPKPSPTPALSPNSTTATTGDDAYNWPIQNVCIPVSRPGDPVVIRDLRDGTYIYQRSDGNLFRGNQNHCKCLAAQTLISTPDGQKIIKDLKEGMSVYTLDRKGNKIAAPLLKVAKVSVPADYVIFHMLLSDGRELLVSGAHPTADNRTVEELRDQDNLDGARILKKDLVPYGDLFTYDILPAGGTGLYWANDILLKSMLTE